MQFSSWHLLNCKCANAVPSVERNITNVCFRVFHSGSCSELLSVFFFWTAGDFLLLFHTNLKDFSVWILCVFQASHQHSSSIRKCVFCDKKARWEDGIAFMFSTLFFSWGFTGLEPLHVDASDLHASSFAHRARTGAHHTSIPSGGQQHSRLRPPPRPTLHCWNWRHPGVHGRAHCWH